MSSGVPPRGEVAALRAMAHPLRLRILSLLTGSPMSAAEVARELDITHANASYHLRLLHDTGLLVPAGEEAIRGGRARRYRYDVERPPSSSTEPGTAILYFRALAEEMVRRAELRRVVGTTGTSSDADLWVRRPDWERTVARVSAALQDLHLAASAPRTPGTMRVSATTALFEMGEEA